MPEAPLLRIDWEPLGIRSETSEGNTILEAARHAGVKLSAFCGGGGTCGACRVIVRNGECSPLTETERTHLTGAELENGMRLACQARILSPLKLHIPMNSLSSTQRLQLEGTDLGDIPAEDRNLNIYDLELAEPQITDLRSDEVRLRDALEAITGSRVTIAPGLLRDLSDVLRKNEWKICAAVRDHTVTLVRGMNEPVMGLAVDIGTTKIAAFLVDMRNQTLKAKEGTMNPQIGYGEDVVSRISYAETAPNGRSELHKALIDTLNELIGKLCGQAGCVPEQIADAVVVCNTAIHHFFADLPVRQLGLYPFIPSVTDALCLSAASLGLHLSPGASVFLPPNIAGYVGADHTAMLIGIGGCPQGVNRMAVDIGTNTEITLSTRDGRSFCCSCASGPAFEGAHIRNGMRAASGAIEKAAFVNGKLQYSTIGNEPPAGICGSGILDLVCALKDAGAVSESGRFDPEFPGVEKPDKHYAYKITGNIFVTRSDINEILLAKSAIRTGIEILLKEAGLQDEDLDRFTVAGAFGTYLDLKSAVGIGMLPDLPQERFEQVGNAAGSGARLMLLSAAERKRGELLARKDCYIELTNHPEFKKVYIGSMNLKKGKLPIS